ncbi:MAG: hypothetical protein OSA99_02365 [Acidimicrobiales bacterium]|nr:hypothetical protein [Acidimicrobiales bacterium]
MSPVVSASGLVKSFGPTRALDLFARCMSQVALLAAGFVVAAALRPGSEETAGRAEQVLALPVSRTSWLRSHLLVAAGGAALVTASGGLGVGTSYAVVSRDITQVARMLGAALTTLPAVLLLGALAVALFGLSQRWAVLAWIGLAATVFIQFFGPLLQLPGWILALSPLHHVPGLPAQRFDAGPLLALLLGAALLVALGIRSLRARDLASA